MHRPCSARDLGHIVYRNRPYVTLPSVCLSVCNHHDAILHPPFADKVEGKATDFSVKYEEKWFLQHVGHMPAAPSQATGHSAAVIIRIRCKPEDPAGDLTKEVFLKLVNTTHKDMRIFFLGEPIPSEWKWNANGRAYFHLGNFDFVTPQVGRGIALFARYREQT